MKVDLKNKEWAEFVFDKVFKIYSTNSGIDKNKLILKKGNTPYITRTDKNNAIDFFISEQKDRYKKDAKNVITIGLDTQTVFYQSYEFYTGQNIQILSNDKLNPLNAQFLIPLIKKQMEKFSWGGNGATLTRLKRSKIILPIDKSNEPDFVFMEQFMHSIEQNKLEQYDSYIQKKLNELKNYKEVKSLNEKDWKEFCIGDLFDTYIGRNIDGNKISKLTGKTAYITRKESNNGLDGFIDFNQNFINAEYPVITIGNETAEPFVQPFPFFTGTKVNILKSKIPVSSYTLRFIAECLKKHKVKYSYSFTINSTRLKRQKILLPINSKNKPDYEYMENYIKKIEFEKLTQYLDIQKVKKDSTKDV